MDLLKFYHGIRYLALLEYNEVYDKIKYLINEKSGITDNINRTFERIRTDSYNHFPIEKILT